MTPTMQEIKEAVAPRWDVTVLDLVSRRNTKAIIRARHVTMWLCLRLTIHNMADIGRAFGNRDRSTVFNAIARIDIAMKFEPTLRRTLLELADQLGGDVPCLSQPRLELVA